MTNGRNICQQAFEFIFSSFSSSSGFTADTFGGSEVLGVNSLCYWYPEKDDPCFRTKSQSAAFQTV